MATSQSDFNNWLQDDVTKQVMVTIKERLFNASKQFLGYPRSDLDNVNWLRGYMTAYEELLNITFDEATETND